MLLRIGGLNFEILSCDENRDLIKGDRSVNIRLVKTEDINAIVDAINKNPQVWPEIIDKDGQQRLSLEPLRPTRATVSLIDTAKTIILIFN